MPSITISREDMLRSKTIKPEWYKAKVKRVGEKPAKTDGSTTWPVDFIIVTPGEFEGVPVNTVFSEKAPGFAVKFIEACGGTIGKDGGSFDLARAEGKELMIYVDNDVYDSRLTNKVKDYKQVTA